MKLLLPLLLLRLRLDEDVAPGRLLLELPSACGVVESCERDRARLDLARDAAEAEELAIAAWRVARPGCSFRPLLTLASAFTTSGRSEAGLEGTN